MKVQRLTSSIGAEVSGVDLASELDASTVAALRTALLDHLVLFFRDQELEGDRHVRFA